MRVCRYRPRNRHVGCPLNALAVTELVDVFSVVRDGGVVGLLVFIVVSGAKGWWVYGTTYREMREERDAYREKAERGVGHSERATDLADQLSKMLTEAERKAK